MPFVHIRKGWEIPSSEATPEPVFLNRRQFLKAMGVQTAGLAAAAAGCLGREQAEAGLGLDERGAGALPWTWRDLPEIFPAPRNETYKLDRPLTPEKIAGSYINFYEFTTTKELVPTLAKKLRSHPWKVEVTGLVRKPATFDIDDLLKSMPLEERLYRHRCVEAWSMAVPWTGFPMKALIDKVEPLASARHVRMLTFLDKKQAPGQEQYHWYPWPYFEGLTIEEAANELTLLATGIYGHALPNQHGAPIRLVVPWKYGFKSIKSIVRIEFVEERPKTFWNEVQGNEYGFYANVTPDLPHPRWSQATERDIGTGERRPTMPFNGYGEYVAGLYQGIEKRVHGF